MTNELIGSFIIDKPAGITSHDVVSRVRRIAGTRRVGHAGTLDPFATGVLVVCVNQATRLVQFLVGLDKEYLATIRFGFATDTQDGTGKQMSPLVTSNELKMPQVRLVLNGFVGNQLQMPPMYSAKKVDGQRLHVVARAGKEVERMAAPIRIYSLNCESDLRPNQDGTCDLDVRVACSTGTYVRTLAHDIGQEIGTGAHLAQLRRTRVGRFDIQQAVTLDSLAEAKDQDRLADKLISPSETVGHLPVISFGEEDVTRINHGREVLLGLEADAVDPSSGMVRLCDRGGNLVAIGRQAAESRTVKPSVVLT